LVDWEIENVFNIMVNNVSFNDTLFEEEA